MLKRCAVGDRFARQPGVGEALDTVLRQAAQHFGPERIRMFPFDYVRKFRGRDVGAGLTSGVPAASRPRLVASV